MTVSTNIIIYLFSKMQTVGGRSFLTNPRTIFITIYSFELSTYHELKFLLRFCNKYDFYTIPEFEKNQQFKPKHMFIIIEYQHFL